MTEEQTEFSSGSSASTRSALSEEKHTLAWYQGQGEQNCKYCSERFPFKPVKLGSVEFYPHDGGWIVKDFKEKQWLYKTCPKCGYQWALWKLGVERQ